VKRCLELPYFWNVPAASERQRAAGCNEWFAARATLHVPQGTSESLRLHVAADTKYDLYLNGKPIVREGGLKRGPTPTGTYVDTLTLPRSLFQTENQLAVLLWYFGKDGFSHKDSGAPGLLVGTDAGTVGPWRMRRHPAYFSAGELRPSFRLSENSVGFSALHAMPGWTEAGFDDQAWPLAEAAEPAGCGPWGELHPRPVPQWQWSEPAEYLSVRKVAGVNEDQYFCRLPHNMHLVPIVECEASAGLRITAGAAQDTNRFEGVYITGTGKLRHEFPGWINGEEIVYRLPQEGIRDPVFRYRETRFASEFAGSFHCGDEVLNALWQKARRTLVVTMRDTFMDCPCRERAQWPGDFVIQLLQVPYCLDGTALSLVRKAAWEFLLWQQPDGSLYGPVPEGNWHVELPAQMLALLSRYGIWNIHRHTKDEALLREFVSRSLRYLEVWEFEETGLVRYRPQPRGAFARESNHRYDGLWDWIDWGVRIDAEPALNAWMALALEGVEFAAREIGAVKHAEDLANRRVSLIEAIRRQFWDAERAAFASSNFEGAPDDRVQALMALAGAVNAENVDAVRTHLHTVEFASPYMEYYVLEAMFHLGDAAGAIHRMQRRFRSLATNDCSTLWERWPEWSEHPGTINHSWSGGPLELLSARVAGLRPASPGWGSAVFEPAPGELSEFGASVETPSGVLEIEARKQADDWQISLRAPHRMTVLCDMKNLGWASKPFAVSGTGTREMLAHHTHLK
jgi:alpha-L-rhamnosidase